MIQTGSVPATVYDVSSSQPPPALSAGLRWVRALVVATSTWCAASAAHLLGGGHLPTVAIMAAFIVVTAWPMHLALSRQASRWRLLALLGVGQAAMHATFGISAAWSASKAALPVDALAMGRHHHVHVQLPPMSGFAPGGESAVLGAGHTMSILPTPLMLLAHVSAALLLGCLLATIERGIFSMLAHLVQLARPALLICAPLLRVMSALTAECTRPQRETVPRFWDGAGPTVAGHLMVGAIDWRGPPRVTLTGT